MRIEHCPYHPGYPRNNCPWNHDRRSSDWEPPLSSRVRRPSEQKSELFTPSNGNRRCPVCNGTRVQIRGSDGSKIRCSICLGSGQVNDEPRCYIGGCDGQVLFDSWGDVYEHMKAHDKQKPVTRTPIPSYQDIGTHRRTPLEKMPLHQFIAVKPGSVMCVNCGNSEDRGNHPIHKISSMTSVSDEPLGPVVRTMPATPSPGISPTKKPESEIPGPYLVRPHKFVATRDGNTLCRRCVRPKRNAVHNIPKATNGLRLWLLVLIVYSALQMLFGLAILMPEINHDLGVMFYSVLYSRDPYSAGTFWQAWEQWSVVAAICTIVLAGVILILLLGYRLASIRRG